MVNDASIDVTSLDFISDNVARTTHRKTSSLTTMSNRNVVIASFVTAYARLELYEVIHKLDSSVLYYDTDSVIFVENVEKGHTLTTGEYLGDMTNELEENNCSEKWIEQFCATGPKSYSYRTNEYERTKDDGSTVKQRDEIVHVKGFTLKGDAGIKITFDSINSCIKKKKNEIEVTYRVFVRGSGQTIAVEHNIKKFVSLLTNVLYLKISVLYRMVINCKAFDVFSFGNPIYLSFPARFPQ